MILVYKFIINPDLYELDKELKSISSYSGIYSYNTNSTEIVLEMSDLYLEEESILVDEIINSHINTREEIIKIKNSYEIHIKNGNEFFEEYRAKLVLEYKLGKIDFVTLESIEDTLDPVETKIRRGNWITGRSSLLKITPDEYTTETIIQELLEVFDNYINNNY